MQIQTLTKGPEKVFVVVKNGEGGTISKGQIVVWSMDGTNDGVDVEDASAAKMPLVVGLADADIADGDYGLAQVYGYDDDAIIYKHGTATGADMAVGDVLNIASAIEGLSAVMSGNAWNCAVTWASGATNASQPALNVAVPMFVAAETMASSSATATTTAKVFIRAL